MAARAYFLAVFAPEGWPSSVAPEYGRYQLWDTIQQVPALEKEESAESFEPWHQQSAGDLLREHRGLSAGLRCRLPLPMSEPR